MVRDLNRLRQSIHLRRTKEIRDDILTIRRPALTESILPARHCGQRNRVSLYGSVFGADSLCSFLSRSGSREHGHAEKYC